MELATQILTYAGFRLAQSPCVYVWQRGETVLYIGVSKQGLSRVLRHNVLDVIEPFLPGDEIKVLYYSSEDLAHMIERTLIREMRPKHNKMSNPDYAHNAGIYGGCIKPSDSNVPEA